MVNALAALATASRNHWLGSAARLSACLNEGAVVFFDCKPSDTTFGDPVGRGTCHSVTAPVVMRQTSGLKSGWLNTAPWVETPRFSSSPTTLGLSDTLHSFKFAHATLTAAVFVSSFLFRWIAKSKTRTSELNRRDGSISAQFRNHIVAARFRQLAIIHAPCA
jgi:hypothetical protein